MSEVKSLPIKRLFNKPYISINIKKGCSKTILIIGSYNPFQISAGTQADSNLFDVIEEWVQLKILQKYTVFILNETGQTVDK